MLRPAAKSIKGVLVLLPGYAEPPENIFPETKLFNTGWANGVLVIAIAGGERLYADSTFYSKMNACMKDVRKHFPDINSKKFVIGGFSAGGTLALRYTEYCHEQIDNAPMIPAGVFTVDSPVDLIDIWYYFEREMKKNYSQAGVSEAKFISNKMRNEIGTPETHPEKYNLLTPFNANLHEPGNEKFLRNVAVRVYEDTDIEWQLKERRRSYYDTNILNASELINRLLLMGNTKAEFVTAHVPGYRSNGMRHPHSWSIVDETECIQWCLKVFSEN